MEAQELTLTVSESLERVGTVILLYLPSILGALTLLLLGGLLAYVLGWLTRSLMGRGLRRLSRTKTVRARLQQSEAYQSLPRFLGQLVFWVVLLFFIAASVEALGLPAVSRVLTNATAYLPRVLVAVIVLFAGFWLGELARGLASRAASSLDVSRSELLGHMARALVILLAAIVAIDQLGVNSTLLVMVVTTLLATMFGAASLAFGLGAKQAVSNIIGLHYFRQMYDVGDQIRINDLEGTVIKVSNTYVTLDTKDGRTLVPGCRFSNETSMLLSKAS